ncbi:hypothetical protein [Wenxinia marina]|uniref:Adenylate kinase n=1 Tax=Wenxinia marina DSM 24838 TaxID=1123501 RepID=A0A0D0QCE0_9RHOB|nr:hypothetical protein [Wenxinia marina]KIQ69992.1 Adenylate kinase [Wenxinia marina DSM 24838]GGL62705.1 hypothetical protein GCM10011392_16670 [Wenxinia marina]
MPDAAAPRIYVTGASGTGTSTLGAALAEALAVPHVDTDAHYWAPSEVPFTVKAAIPDQLETIAAALGQGGWVWSGSADGWGDPLIGDATLIVFLTLPGAQRLARLKARERRLYGDRIAPGGDMERVHREFMTWAAGYDDPYFGGRSLHRHRTWLARQAAPVMELSGADPVTALVARVCADL